MFIEAVFTEEMINREFEAFKQQMFILRQGATQEKHANYEFLLSKIYHDDDVLKQAFPSLDISSFRFCSSCLFLWKSI